MQHLKSQFVTLKISNFTKVNVKVSSNIYIQTEDKVFDFDKIADLNADNVWLNGTNKVKCVHVMIYFLNCLKKCIIFANANEFVVIAL